MSQKHCLLSNFLKMFGCVMQSPALGKSPSSWQSFWRLQQRNSRSFPKSKSICGWMCCGICLQTYKSEASLKKMQLDETAKFWKVLWTHVNMICVSKCLTCLFYFYKLYYEIRRLWLLKNVKSVYSFKTDNCLELLSFQAWGLGRLRFLPASE